MSLCCERIFVQVLVKSCKMVPVMLMGTLLHGRRYAPLEYVCMSLIGEHMYWAQNVCC